MHKRFGVISFIDENEYTCQISLKEGAKKKKTERGKRKTNEKEGKKGERFRVSRNRYRSRVIS